MRIAAFLARVLLASAAATLPASAVSAAPRDAEPVAGPASPQSGAATESTAADFHGDERLVWDQPASSAGDVAGFRFVVYVDGRRLALPSVTCASEPGPDGFACSAPLPSIAPGVHLVEVAARATGGQPADERRSGSIWIRLGSGGDGSLAAAGSPAPGLDAALPATPAASDSAAPAGPSLDLTTTTADGTRLRATEVASGLEDATDILPLPDGRLLVAERGGRVRVFRDGVLLAAAAVTLDDVAVGNGRGLLAIAANSDFAATRHVFATYTTEDGLRVVRLTALGDRLVDRAVLVEGLPVASAQPAALLRSGPDGRLYLALDDGGDPQRLHDMGSYGGKVLRLSTDGTTPDNHPGRSPVWSIGVSHPVGLAWSVDRTTLRVVGVEPHDVALQQASSPAAAGPGRDITRLSLPPSFGASSAAIGAGPSVPAFRDSLFIASAVERAILRVWFAGGDVPGGSEWLIRDLPGPVTALAVAPDGAIYAAAGSTLLRIVAER